MRQQTEEQASATGNGQSLEASDDKTPAGVS